MGTVSVGSQINRGTLVHTLFLYLILMPSCLISLLSANSKGVKTLGSLAFGVMALHLKQMVVILS